MILNVWCVKKCMRRIVENAHVNYKFVTVVVSLLLLISWCVYACVGMESKYYKCHIERTRRKRRIE
jgi:hypothetical protein